MWHSALLPMIFFFNDTATTEIYTLSLHDALPISGPPQPTRPRARRQPAVEAPSRLRFRRSEEHTSELQSLAYLVCRLLLEKKKLWNIHMPSSFFTLSLSTCWSLWSVSMTCSSYRP